jgi:hypothetical protein
MKKQWALGCMTLTAMTLAACGSSTKQAAENTVNDDVHSMGLMATYSTACQSSPLDILNLKAVKVQYIFTGTIEKRTTFYSDSQCQQSQVLVISETGEYTPHGTVNGDPNTIRADIRFNKTTITPKQNDLVNAMNAIPALPGSAAGYCGINSWANNQTKDVSTDSGSANCLGTDKIGATAYDLINNANGQLHFGLATPLLDKSTSDKRPTVIDPTVLGTK